MQGGPHHPFGKCCSSGELCRLLDVSQFNWQVHKVSSAVRWPTLRATGQWHVARAQAMEQTLLSRVTHSATIKALCCQDGKATRKLNYSHCDRYSQADYRPALPSSMPSSMKPDLPGAMALPDYTHCHPSYTVGGPCVTDTC